MARLFVRTSSQYINVEQQVITAYPFTMAIWAYPITLPTSSWACASGGTGYAGITVLNTGVLRSQIDSSFSSATIAGSASGLVTTGSWQHFCGVFASGTNALKIYRNGTQAAQATNSETFPVTARHSAGRLPPGGTANHWDGRLAEHAIWNVALTVDEIAALAQGVSPNRIRPQALLLYWPLWGAHEPEPDLSGNRRNGTLYAAPTQISHAPMGPLVPMAR